MTSLYLPACTYLGSFALTDFRSLETLVMPNLQSIQSGIGSSCSTIRSVYFLSSEIPWVSNYYSHYLPYYNCTNVSFYVRQSLVSGFEALFASASQGTPTSFYNGRFVGLTDAECDAIIAEAETW